MGLDNRQFSRAEHDGELIRIAAGVYTLPADRSPDAMHRLRVMSASTTPDAVMSHESAAVMLGLDVLCPDFSRINMTSAHSTRGYKRRFRHIHPGPLSVADVVEKGGMWVTSVERTAFDVARSSAKGFAGALAALDVGLRNGGDPARIAAFCARPCTGVGLVRCALPYASPLSESVGESWSRAQMIDSGVPMPILQRKFYDNGGTFIGRADFCWVDDNGEVRLVGEFDGIGKYLKYLKPGEKPTDVIKREKEREGRLQDMGIVVVRWLFDHLVAGTMVSRVTAQMTTVGLTLRPTNPVRFRHPA